MAVTATNQTFPKATYLFETPGFTMNPGVSHSEWVPFSLDRRRAGLHTRAMATNLPDNDPSDEQLAATLAQREQSGQALRAAQDAFRDLYQRHARKLLAFLAARVHRNDLEDVHQEVWERIWKHLPEGFHGGNFRAWLY